MAFWNNNDDRRRREAAENGRQSDYDFTADDSFADRSFMRGGFNPAPDYNSRSRSRRLTDLPPVYGGNMEELPPIRQDSSYGRFDEAARPQRQVNPPVQPASSSYGYRPSSAQYRPEPAPQDPPHTSVSIAGGESSKVVIFAPKTYNDVQTLIDYLKRSEPVIIDFAKISGDSAQRILDFMSGAVYALSGSMQRISQTIFLLTPANLQITVPVEQLKKNLEKKR